MSVLARVRKIRYLEHADRHSIAIGKLGAQLNKKSEFTELGQIIEGDRIQALRRLAAEAWAYCQKHFSPPPGHIGQEDLQLVVEYFDIDSCGRVTPATVDPVVCYRLVDLSEVASSAPDYLADWDEGADLIPPPSEHP